MNLSLRIIRKREDGFHELSSLFQTIDLCDHIQITPAPKDSFTSNCPQISNNLILQALHLFRAKTRISNTYHIDLQKNIPIEAGLGGGSSNAATTLWALNTLNGSPASKEQLMHWGAELGSDVPFFFSSGSAHCTGRGEIVKDVTPITLNHPLWLVKPSIGLSTQEIYQAFDLSTCSKEDQLFTNDLEHPAFLAKPSLKELKQKLERLYDRVVMSGSGTAFICEGATPSGTPIAFMNRDPHQWYHKKSRST